MMFEEYQGSSGAVELQMDLMNPFNAMELVREPSLENLIKSAYMPFMAYLGYYGASALVGQPGPGFWVRQALSYEATKTTIQATARSVTTVAVSPYAAAFAWLGLGFLAYRGILEALEYAIQDVWLGDFAKNDTRGGSEHGLFYSP